MTLIWTKPHETTFRCLRCAREIGTYPETARVQPTCSRCQKQPPAIHEGWARERAK